MSDRKRSFLAVHFSSEVSERIVELQADLKNGSPEKAVKWVEPHNLHLSLQFLGDVDVGLFPKLSGGLRGAFADVQPFPIVLGGVGAFPSAERPRVVWVGFRTGANDLHTLQACVERVTEPLGFSPEKREFRAHVTLGRVKDEHAARGLKPALDLFEKAEAGQCQIGVVELMTSELRSNGPRYSVLDTFPIGR